ncbi:MAG: hypothetical protein ACKV1O_09920 [Saprospiraceae bacterium]
MAKSNEKKRDFFWLSYSDLMTSLFFVMLVLFVLIYSLQNQMIGELKVAKEELDKIKEITRTTQALKDGGLYEYNESCKRFELKQEILFPARDVKIPENARSQLVKAGKQIQALTEKFKEDKKVKFLIVIEGRAAKHIKPERFHLNKELEVWAKELSYGRAMSLFYLWKKNGIDLNTSNSEVYMSGSGFEGQCRYGANEEGKNKRFIVQVIPYLID